MTQLMLTLSATVTYAALTQQLSSELDAPVDRMTIKHGFPPKMLQPPAAGASDDALPIQHGDKITVDISSETNQQPGMFAHLYITLSVRSKQI